MDARRPVHFAARHLARQHDPQRRAPQHRARSRRVGQPAPVDRGLLHPGLRRPAAHRWAASATASAAAARSSPASASSASARCSSALAGRADALIATRALMGIGARADHARHPLDPHQRLPRRGARRRPSRIWAAVAGLGIAIGPVAGGWLIEHFDWSSVFLVNLPVIPRACGRFRARPGVAGPGAVRASTRSAPVLSMVGLGALVWAIIEAPSTAGPTRPSWPASASALVAAHGVRGLGAPTRPRCSTCGSSACARFSGASVAIALVFFALFGAIFFLTQYLQEV